MYGDEASETDQAVDWFLEETLHRVQPSRQELEDIDKESNRLAFLVLYDMANELKESGQDLDLMKGSSQSNAPSPADVRSLNRILGNALRTAEGREQIDKAWISASTKHLTPYMFDGGSKKTQHGWIKTTSIVTSAIAVTVFVGWRLFKRHREAILQVFRVRKNQGMNDGDGEETGQLLQNDHEVAAEA